MQRRTKLIIASVAAVILLGGGLAGAIAFAQTPTPPTGQTPGDVFWTTLASKLSVSADTLKAAFRDAAKAVVAQRVQAGKLSQDQADQLNQRIDKLPLDRPPLPILPLKRGSSPQEKIATAVSKLMLDTAANTLGMSPRDLMGELRDGLTLEQIAQQKGVSPDKLKTALLDAVNARIDEAVKNDTLRVTQEQADALKSKIAEKLDLTKRFPLPKPQPVRPPQGKDVKPAQS